METASIASGKHYEGTIMLKDIVETTFNPNAAKTSGTISLQFKNNIVESVEDITAQWELRSGETSILISSINGIKLTKSREVVGRFISSNITIPTAEDNPQMLFKKGTLSLSLSLHGMVLGKIENAVSIDASVIVPYYTLSNPVLKYLHKDEYNDHPVTIGDTITFMLKCGEGFPSSYKKYLIICENDYGKASYKDYSIQYGSLPKAKVKYTKDGQEKTDNAGVFKFEHDETSGDLEKVSWTVGLADNTIILGNEESNSPDLYEWNIFLLVSPNDITPTPNDEFLPLSEKGDFIVSYDDSLSSHKPHLKEASISEQSKVTPYTVKGSIIFEHININRWIEALDIPKEMLKLVFPNTM